MLFSGGKISGMRTAESHGDSESLGRAHGHVCSHFTGRGQQGQGKRVSGNHHHRAHFMGPITDARKIHDTAIGVGILNQNPETPRRESEILVITDHDFDTQWFGSRLNDLDGLRVTFSDTKNRSQSLPRRALS